MSKVVAPGTKKFVSKVSNRKLLKQKYGSKAFLDPKELEYPIYGSDGKPNCGLLFGAYLRAHEWHKENIAKRAEDIYKKHNCEKSTGRKLHEHYTLDTYITSFSLLESSNSFFAGNVYTISNIDKDGVYKALNEMTMITEGSYSSIGAINAANGASPIITISFKNSTLLRESLNELISEQKKILNNKLILPVKGTMYMDSEMVFHLDSDVRGSLYKFFENANYITINGKFQSDITEATNKLIESLSDDQIDYVIAGIL